MAPSVLETVPPETQEKLLRVVLANPHPRLALGSIASNHQLTMDQLRTILNHHGYPDTDRMRRAIEQLAVSNATPTPPQAAAAGPGMRRVKVTDLHADPDNLLLQPIVAREHGGRLVVVAGLYPDDPLGLHPEAFVVGSVAPPEGAPAHSLDTTVRPAVCSCGGARFAGSPSFVRRCHTAHVEEVTSVFPSVEWDAPDPDDPPVTHEQDPMWGRVTPPGSDGGVS